MTKVIIAGDWHASTNWIEMCLNAAANEGVSTIYHLGDFGFTFNYHWIQWLDKKCREYDVTIKFIDGNHDNHPYLFKVRSNELGEKPLTSRVIYLPRNHRFELESRIFHCLGGAVSVDKYNRQENISWWKEETISQGDYDKAMSSEPADFMLTHDCPSRVDLGLPKGDDSWWPNELLDESDKHRKLFDEIYEHISPEVLLHGHYHMAHVWDEPYGKSIVGLACDGMDRNMLVLEFDSSYGFHLTTIEPFLRT